MDGAPLRFVSIVLEFTTSPGFTMVTEIIRQRSRKALVEVSHGKGRVGAGTGERREAPHGPLSIHWARSSSPVLQQLPARLVRVNKPSAKVKETYKKDIMQTVISADPAEPQIEWRNRLCSLHPPLPIWKWIAGKRCLVSPHGWLMNSIWAVRTLRHRGPGEYKNWQPAYQMAPALALACKEQSLFVNPPFKRNQILKTQTFDRFLYRRRIDRLKNSLWRLGSEEVRPTFRARLGGLFVRSCAEDK